MSTGPDLRSDQVSRYLVDLETEIARAEARAQATRGEDQGEYQSGVAEGLRYALKWFKRILDGE